MINGWLRMWSHWLDGWCNRSFVLMAFFMSVPMTGWCRRRWCGRFRCRRSWWHNRWMYDGRLRFEEFFRSWNAWEEEGQPR